MKMKLTILLLAAVCALHASAQSPYVSLPPQEYAPVRVPHLPASLSFAGERVYVNPFRTNAAMTEDDIAVSTVIVRMGESVRGGAVHYPHAFRDSYLSLVLTAAANDSADAAADAMNW